MFGGFTVRRCFGFDTAVGGPLIGSGDWVFLWKGGCALTDIGEAGGAAPVRWRSSSTWWPSWTPWPRSPPGPWPSGGSGRRSSAGASSAAPSTTRCSAPGPGAAAGSASSATRMELGFGYVDFAGSGVVHAIGGVAGLAGAIVLGPRIGKFNKDGSANTHARPPHPDGHARHASSCCSAGSASTPPRPSRRPTSSSPSWRTNTAIAAAFGATAAMFYMMKRIGKPDPGMMVNGMLAGLVAITAPCAFVQPWAAAVIGIIAARHRHRGRRASSSGAASTTRSAPSRSTASAASSACSASASSPTASTAPAGTSPPRATTATATGVTGILYDVELGRPPARSRRPSASLVICTVIFGIAFAFFKIQNTLMKGGIRSDGGRRDRGPRPPRDGRARLPRVHGEPPSPASRTEQVADPGGTELNV